MPSSPCQVCAAWSSFSNFWLHHHSAEWTGMVLNFVAKHGVLAGWLCGMLEFYIPWVVYPWIPPKWAVLVAKMMKLINHQFFFGYPIFNQIHILHTSWAASLRRSTSLSMDCDKMWQPEPVCSILIPWIVKEPGITSGISWYLPIFSMVHRLIVVKAFAKGLTPSCQMSNRPLIWANQADGTRIALACLEWNKIRLLPNSKMGWFTMFTAKNAQSTCGCTSLFLSWPSFQYQGMFQT